MGKKKKDVDPAHLAREKQAWGVSVMVALGVCYEGAGSLICVEKNVEINGDVYLGYVKSVYQVDCREFYGNNYISQQDNAPAHTKKEVKAWTNANLPRLLEPWPASSPDLNVPDFSVWHILAQHVREVVEETGITTAVGLKAATRTAVRTLNGDLPLVRRRVMDFPRRVKACIDAGGGHFEHKKKQRSEEKFQVLVEEVILNAISPPL